MTNYYCQSWDIECWSHFYDKIINNDGLKHINAFEATFVAKLRAEEKAPTKRDEEKKTRARIELVAKLKAS
jgi:hypothetical protein